MNIRTLTSGVLRSVNCLSTARSIPFAATPKFLTATTRVTRHQPQLRAISVTTIQQAQGVVKTHDTKIVAMGERKQKMEELDDKDSHAQDKKGITAPPDGEDHPSAHQQSESTTGKHDWKTKPPYSIHDKNEDFPVKYEASCHCGRVAYQLSRDAPLDSKLCHCTTCQTQHAAPFQWAAIFQKTDINFLQGHHNLEWYDPTDKSIEHKLPCKVRCNFCHSPILDEGRNMILLFPSLVKFESKEAMNKFKPKCHMFYGQRVIDIPDGLPKWSGLNNESDLIEDSPKEAYEEYEKFKKEKKEKEEKEKKEGKKDEGKKDDKKK